MRSLRRICGALFLLSLIYSLAPTQTPAQIVNGSFEDDGQPSLQGWTFTCDRGQSLHSAPPDGGDWSLKAGPGNLQSCFPGQAFQTIRGVQSEEVWQLSAWARRDTANPTTASIYFRIVDASGARRALSVDTTTSMIWTRLTVTDTLHLNPGDSVQVVLDAGVTSGPTLANVGFNFDLVEMAKAPQAVSSGPNGVTQSNALLAGYPNPFVDTTTIPFAVDRGSFVRLEIYDVLGRRVTTLVRGWLPAGGHRQMWSADDVAPGAYVVRLQTATGNFTRMIVRVAS